MGERVPRSVLAGVGLIALAALLFEVVLTRIFAVTLWYYFGALSISLAMLGMAVAAVLCFLLPTRLVGENAPRSLFVFSLVFVVLVPISVKVHLAIPFTGYEPGDPGFYLGLGVQIAVIFGVFFAAGMCISIALFRHARAVSRVYFFDLVGASVGSLLVVPLLYRFSAPDVVFLVGVFGALAGLCFSRELRKRLVTGVFAALALASAALFVTNEKIDLLEIEAVKSYDSPGMQQHEEAPVFEKWSPVSRVAVFGPRKTESGEVYNVTNDAGAPTVLRRFNGDFGTMQFLTRDFREIVHHLKKGGHALIIGSAGGTDVLASLVFGREKVTAVEINPVIAELVTTHFADYIGRIFRDPRVTLHVQEGRNFVAGSDEQYDIIQITMIDSWGGAAAGAYIFNENSLYTADAVEDYWEHLEPDGILSISRYYSWAEGLRLTNLFVQHLLSSGIEDVHEHIAVVTEKERGYQRATVLLKKSAFTAGEVALIRNVSAQGHFGLVYAPGLPDGQMLQADDARLYRRLIHPEAYPGTDREKLIANYPRDISPPTDDRPFFFFTTRFRDLLDTTGEEHPARRLALPILYGMFVIFGLFGVLSILVPLRLSRRADITAAPFRMRLLVYFCMLGVGYLLVEISLIQRLTVFLGHPTYSFVVVLTTLLFSSGVGSYVSGWWNRRGTATALVQALAGLIVLLAVYVFVVYDLFISLMALAKTWRIVLAVAVLVPPGLLMGMMFPMGIQIARRAHEHLVPWGWGVNGAFSVFASVCSLVISLNLGLKAGLAIGTLCYLVALAVIWSLRTTADDWARTGDERPPPAS
jgi:spermidine synthase